MLAACFTVAANAAPRGDIDGDGTVTPADARLALRAAVQLEQLADWRLADVDGDLSVTSADARLILRAAVGLENLEAGNTNTPTQPSPSDGTSAYTRIYRWVTANGTRHLYTETVNNVMLSLMVNDDPDDDSVSIFVDIDHGQNIRSQTLVLFYQNFEDGFMSTSLLQNNAELAEALFDFDYRNFSYNNRGQSLSVLDSRGNAECLSYIRNNGALLTCYAMTWFYALLVDRIGVDPAKDANLKSMTASPDVYSLPAVPLYTPAAATSSVPAWQRINNWLKRYGTRLDKSYSFREESKNTSATLMSSTDPDSDHPVSIGVIQSDGSYTYQLILIFDREFSECIAQVKLKRGSTELRMNMFEVNHSYFSYATKDKCLTLLGSSGNAVYQSQIDQKASTLVYTALGWFRKLLIDPDLNIGVDPVNDVHLNNLR